MAATFLSRGLLPLPALGTPRSVGSNAPLWALVSLAAVFLFLWSSALGLTPALPSLPQIDLLAPTEVLARLGVGKPPLVIEVDGKTVRARDLAQVEAALVAAGLKLES